jgi:hypothetical protein
VESAAAAWSRDLVTADANLARGIATSGVTHIAGSQLL